MLTGVFSVVRPYLEWLFVAVAATFLDEFSKKFLRNTPVDIPRSA
jgi:hypothetical protein